MDLKEKYEKCLIEDDSERIFDFIDMLMKDDSQTILEFHYSLLLLDNNSSLSKHIRIAFKERKEKGKLFLLGKLKDEKNDKLISESIHILGKMRCDDILPYCYKYINHENNDLRYKAIIVIGWVGNIEDLNVLNDHMYVESEIDLTGYCATAMRQIWFRFPESKEKILRIYKEALENITDPKIWPYILICVQDLLCIKLGIKEDAASLHFKKDINLIKENGLEELNKVLSLR